MINHASVRCNVKGCARAASWWYARTGDVWLCDDHYPSWMWDAESYYSGWVKV